MDILKNSKYGYQRGLASVVYRFFHKKTSGRTAKNEMISNKELEELHRRIIRKFKKIKVQSPFIDNIWGADLADMQLIRKLVKDLDFYYV